MSDLYKLTKKEIVRKLASSKANCARIRQLLVEYKSYILHLNRKIVMLERSNDYLKKKAYKYVPRKSQIRDNQKIKGKGRGCQKSRYDKQRRDSKKCTKII